MSQARKMRHCLICARVCYAPSRFIWTIFPICRMCALCWRFLKTWACNLKWRREQSRSIAAGSYRVLHLTSASKRCAPRFWRLVRCSRVSARRMYRCRAAARLARAPLISILPVCARWAPPSTFKRVISTRARRLKGCRFVFDCITVTGTENLLMAATLAEGETVLENAAREPEVSDLATLLCAMGAHIQGIGTHRLVIQGVPQLHGARHRVIPDRIEAGTFLCAAAATRGRSVLRHIQPGLLDAALEKLCEAGAKISAGRDWIRVQMNRRPRAVSFQTAEYPRFPTDLQAQFMALGCISNGGARIVETIFENRLMHVQALRRLGARIHTHHNTAFVTGVPCLSGATVTATDLRASASLVIAGLVADGETWVKRIDHLDRGYDQMEMKLAALGANVRRVDAEDTHAEVVLKRIANARAA